VSTHTLPTNDLPEQWPAIYQPSETIGRSRYLTVLRSPDSVRELADFYATELDRGGWRTTHRIVTAASATLVARRGPHGATISINDTGMGSAVSIGSY